MTRRQHLSLWLSVVLMVAAAVVGRVFAPTTIARDRHVGVVTWWTEGSRPAMGPPDGVGNPSVMLEWLVGAIVGRSTAPVVLTAVGLSVTGLALQRTAAHRLTGVWPWIVAALSLVTTSIWMSATAWFSAELLAVAAMASAMAVITATRPTPWVVVGALCGVSLWATPAALIMVVPVIAAMTAPRRRPDNFGWLLAGVGLLAGAAPRLVDVVSSGADGVTDMVSSLGSSRESWRATADAVWAMWTPGDDAAQRWPLVVAVAAAVVIPAAVMLWRRPRARDALLAPFPLALCAIGVMGDAVDSTACLVLAAPSLAWWITVALSAVPDSARPLATALSVCVVALTSTVGTITAGDALPGSDRDDLRALSEAITNVGGGAIRVETDQIWAVTATANLPTLSTSFDRSTIEPMPRRVAVLVDTAETDTVWTSLVADLTTMTSIDIIERGRWRAAVADVGAAMALDATSLGRL